MHDVATYKERHPFSNDIGKVYEGGPVGRRPSQHQQLGPVSLDVVRVVCQGLSALHGSDESLSVSRAAPVGIRVPADFADFSLGSYKMITLLPSFSTSGRVEHSRDLLKRLPSS